MTWYCAGLVEIVTLLSYMISLVGLLLNDCEEVADTGGRGGGGNIGCCRRCKGSGTAALPPDLESLTMVSCNSRLRIFLSLSDS